MDKILAQRYAFCDFTNISGFLNPKPDRSEWEGCLLRFRGEDWEVSTEFLLHFHECMLKLKVVHEDVFIKLFRYSLDGAARDWCRSLPIASISSLNQFHASFHLFCKEKFSTGLLYPECCNDFYFLCKGVDNHERTLCVEEDIAVEETIHDKLDVEHLPAIIISDYYGSKDLFPLDSNHEDHLSFSEMELENSKGSQQQFSILHIEEIGSNYKTRHVQKKFSFQLEQQQEEVFLYDFFDPIVDYLESLSSTNVKLFLSNESWFCCLSKLHFCMPWILLFFRSRSRILPVSPIFSWLHWKHDLT